MKEYLITIIGFFIAFSGWGKVLYDHVTSRPKIRGRIFQVIIAQMADPINTGNSLTAFITYIYLVNKRRNSIHVLDYEMEIKINRKWVRLKRVYGVHNVKNYFNSASDAEIQVNNFEDNLIYRKNRPVEYGLALHGWIVFAASGNIQNNNVHAFRLTCIDVFQKKHRIITNSNEFGNISLLQDIADIKIVKKN